MGFVAIIIGSVKRRHPWEAGTAPANTRLQELVTNAESKPIPLAIWVTSAPTIAYIGNFINKADLGRQNAFAAYLIISAELMSVTTIGTGGKMDQRQPCAPNWGTVPSSL